MSKNAPSSPEKVTPSDGLSWWIKWGGTSFLLAALVTRAAGINPVLDIMLSFNGAVCWLIVGLMWHDRALTILNAVAGILLIIAFLNSTLV